MIFTCLVDYALLRSNQSDLAQNYLEDSGYCNNTDTVLTAQHSGSKLLFNASPIGVLTRMFSHHLEQNISAIEHDSNPLACDTALTT